MFAVSSHVGYKKELVMSNKDIFYPGLGDRYPAFYIQYNKETKRWEVYFHN